MQINYHMIMYIKKLNYRRRAMLVNSWYVLRGIGGRNVSNSKSKV